ncbi:hypothetical protein B0A48_10624 [Cryoendolithus antarcticus]|uniref:Flavoprotein domain-containing protein n=1 Tax=Cryoendolithus antarcticus TaxID=1507870 RepID=A0A1V8SY81_9PEZI|nr:hypothetical protein B0A48_10624 [Cryoendolithus antarcticus]
MATSPAQSRPSRPPRPRRGTATPELDTGMRNNELKIIFASVGCTDSRLIDELLPSLADIPDVSLRAVLDKGYRGQDMIKASTYCQTMPNVARQLAVRDVVEIEQEAAELCEWADLLVIAPMDANNLAKMLHGDTDNLLLEVLRSWNVSKKVLMVPGMSSLMWENPMTKKQLTKIRRKWNFVQVLHPLLWAFEGDRKKITSWEALEEVTEAVRNQVDLMNIGKDVQVSPSQRQVFSEYTSTSSNRLPPELWSLIIDHTGDWELAQTLHIYTNLPPPPEWTWHTKPQGPRNYMEALELTILRGNLADVKHFIATHSVPRWLSKLCIKLIMRFAMTDLLAYLETTHHTLFWTTFGHTFLPDKASSVFGRTEILEFWRTSPSFLTKEYKPEALDGASRAGFVNVLEWWQHSNLPLKYTEAAMEQASAQNHIPVLEWWRTQSSPPGEPSSPDSTSGSPPLRLKPGKSLVFATQNGHLPVLDWYLTSTLPTLSFPHEDTVPKLASTHNHPSLLALWHSHKGNKMQFDNQVLIGATKGGHVEVLEWWKKSGLRVEYKTCDVEEALEDGLEGEGGVGVRRWWATNGLNLGVGTSEWMRVKVL